MRAAYISEPGHVEVTDVAEPTPGPGEALIRVEACGLCGTDLHIREGEFGSLPVVPGHEFAGEVVGLGPENPRVAPSAQVRVGDRVAVDPSLYCHTCHYCRLGKSNLCELWGGIGVTVAGGAAELAVAPVENCVVLPEHVATRDAALIEPLSCAVRGYDVLSSQLGAHVLIYGSGTMGLMMLQLAKRVGAASVEVLDVNPERLKTAARLGCSATAATADELDRPYGWELVVDATGNEKAIQDGLGRVGKGGTFLQFGVSAYAARATIEPYKIYNREITITGSMAVLHSYERAAELFADGVLDPEVFISDRLPLADYVKGLETFAAGQGRKIQVLPQR